MVCDEVGGRVVGNGLTSVSAPVCDGDLAKVVLRVIKGSAIDMRMEGDHLSIRDIKKERL